MISNILQPTHLIILLLAVLLIIGPKRLPEAGRALGHGINEFKNAIGGAPDSEELEAGDHGVSQDATRDRL